MNKNVFTIAAVLIALVAGAIGGYKYDKNKFHKYDVNQDGNVTQQDVLIIINYMNNQLAQTETDEEWTAWDLEQAEIEIKAIYQLLAANAFTSRTNMNMSFKTNQYMKKVMEEQDIDPAIEKEATIKYLEHLVKNMPELEGGNKTYFDTFYRKPLEQLKSEE